MNTKHTAGPWRVEDNEGSLRIVAPDERTTIICEGVGPASNESAKADAALIAAAPELLEALEAAQNYLVERGVDVRGVTGRTVILPKMQAAIAKATGKEAP